MSEENYNEQQEKEPSELFAKESESKPESRSPRQIQLSTFVCSCVAIIVATVLLTYTVCNNMFRKAERDEIFSGTPSTTDTAANDAIADDLALIAEIFESLSIHELDEAALKDAVLKAYVAATGDRYAAYYTDEEFAALMADIGGQTQGVGVNIINAEVDISGIGKVKALKIINVVPDSPAERGEIRFGDYIFAVGTLEDYSTVHELDYDMALKQLQGVAGTNAQFVVYRPSTDEFIEKTIMREEFTANSVMYTKAEDAVGENIGVIKIIEFDSTTPDGVSSAIEALKAQGCDKFVFDVRYNPGGTLDSIVATLSFFLDEGDTVIRTKDKAGNWEITKVAPFTRTSGCSVSAEDIGKYKGLNMVVLCNGSTASAAELFTANFIDHGLGDVIGTKTFGKGSMQSFIPLTPKGSGVLKLTTYMYYPPTADGYDGIGIEPTHTVEQSGEALEQNVYEIMGKAADTQLYEAVKHFK